MVDVQNMLRCVALLLLVAGAPHSEAGPDTPDNPLSLPHLASAWGATEQLQERIEAALAARRGRVGMAPLHVVQIGDSLTEGGFFSRELARQLAPGRPTSPSFLWPGLLTPGEVEVVRLGRWRDWREVSWLDEAAVGPFGPRGVYFSATRPEAALELRTSAALPEGTRVTLYYAPLPGHRPAELRTASGKVLARIRPPKEPPTSTLGRVELFWPPGESSLVLQTVGTYTTEEFRFYGFTVDRPDVALSYDVLGVVGTTADHPLQKDDGAQVEFLRHRAPDLLVVWFGTNSAVVRPFEPEPFRQSFAELLDRLREALPDASLLVLGPPDLARRPEGCPSWVHKKRRQLYPHEREELRRFACEPESSVVRRGRSTVYPARGIRTEAQWQDWLARCSFTTLPTIQVITDLERSAALALGGMFFDTYAFMGREGSIHRWACQQPQLAHFDHVHLTPEGHAQLAQGVGEALRTGSR